MVYLISRNSIINFLLLSYILLENSLMSNTKAQMKDDYTNVSNNLKIERPREDFFHKDKFNEKDFQQEHKNKMIVVIFNVDYQIISSNADEPFKKLPINRSEYWQINIKNHDWLIYDKNFRTVDNNYTIRIIKSIQDITTTLNYIKIGFIISRPLILASAFGIGLLIARKALRPIYDIVDTAQEIESGDLSLRISNIEGKDEIATLAKSFNSMVDYLEDAIIREQQFSVDASHELRTPLAIILNYSDELIKDSNSKHHEEYQIINDEATKMKKIISQLLKLARGELKQYNLDLEKVNLNEIVESIIEQMKLFAKEKNIQIEFNSKELIEVNIDESLWTQLFINLIDNAIKYTPE